MEYLCLYRKVEGMALVIRGSEDDLIPPQTAANFAAALGVQVETLPGLDHGSAHNPSVMRRIMEWVESSTEPYPSGE
jgi:pimeloyl-ACP methyl ester carboxylesterase